MNPKAICHLSVMPMRAEPRHASEMVSQIIFGEGYEILETKESWLRICCLHDGYEGWINCRKPFLSEDNSSFKKLNETTFNSNFSQATFGEESIMLTPGCPLSMFLDNKFLLGDTEYHFNGEINNTLLRASHYAMQFINTPYLWGGRTIWGIDCSGFTQICFRLAGIELPRDAYQQAEKGDTISSLAESIENDLVFFSENGNRITHVGILLGNGKIIHASDTVRIDRIDDEGIFSGITQAYTLKAVLIKRFS